MNRIANKTKNSRSFTDIHEVNQKLKTAIILLLCMKAGNFNC